MRRPSTRIVPSFREKIKGGLLTNGKKEEIWSHEDLKEIMRNLAVLSEHSVREFYRRAYRECAIINSHTFPPARAVQELVQAWKQLRKWRRP